MSITRDVSTNEQNKFVESTAVPGQPVLPVANADGTPLSVSVSASDIQIGAVEIKNATDDTRATVRDLAANDALNVAIVDGAGDQITTFGGGTQYTEGATDATITGTVSMWEDAADTVVATSATKPLPVNIISGAGSGGTAAADDADFTAGTTSGTPAQGVYESTPTTVTDGDLGTVGITSGRRLKTSATVDAALPAGTNAIGKLAANSGVDIGDVDVLSSALPTGASTSAKQDTVIGHLDGVETLLTTIAGDTTDIEAALETAGGLVVNLGANNDVTVTGAVDLGATDNAVLDAIAASTAAIETAVEGTLTVTGGGGGTEYTEDVATANPIVGTATMIERDDALSAVTPIEGDNIGLRGTAEGALWTQDFNSDAILADTTAILADTAAIEVATEATQAALETAGGLVVNLGANNDVTVTSGAITETNSGAIKTAVEVLDNAISGSEMQVDVVAALPAGTNAIGKLAANSGVDIGDVDVTSVTLGTYAVDDSAMPATPQTLPISAEYRLAATTYADGDVTVLQSDENGSLKVTLANQLAGEDLTNNLLKVGGNIAHDSADAGNPVKVGGKAASSEPAAVAAADRVDAYFDTTGHQHVKVDAIAAGTANIGDVDVFSNTAKDGSGTRYQPLVDTDGHLQIDVLSGGGGGTQYTEADTDASITGTAMLWEDTSDTLRAVSAAKPLPVDIQDSTIAVTQSGTWDEVGINDSGNSITVDYATTGSGTATGALRVELPTNGTGVIATVGAVTAISNALPAGTNAIGKLAANTGVDIGDVDVTSVVPGTGATNLGKAEDAAHTTGDVGVMALGVRNDALNPLTGTTGDYSPLSVSDKGVLYVGLLSSDGQVMDAGDSLYVQEVGQVATDTSAIKTALQIMDDWDNGASDGASVSGDVAHDTADAGEPVKIGGKAHSSTPTAVAANDRVNAYFDLRGRQQITPAVPEQDLATEATTHVKKYYTNSGAVTDGIVWSSAAGKRWYVTDIFINVSAAATVTLEDDLTAGDAAIWKAELAANSGWSHHFGTPLFSGEDAADLLVTTTAGNIYITVTGYEV